MVALGTTTRRGIPTEIPIGPEEGLSKQGVISAGDLYTVSLPLLLRRAGVMSRAKRKQLDGALTLALGLAK